MFARLYYKQARQQADGCQPPVPHLAGSVNAPLVQIVNGQGEAVYAQSFYIDPRIVLWGAEPPEPGEGRPAAPLAPEGPNYLPETSIDVAVPLVKGAETFEFFESAGMQESGQAPAVSIPIGDALGRYQQGGAMLEEATCQQPKYKPDALR